MKTIVRTSTGGKYRIECDNIVERANDHVVWLAFKKEGKDIIKYNLDYVESIQFID